MRTIGRSLTIFGLAALLGSTLGAQTAGPSPQKRPAPKPQAAKPATPAPAPAPAPAPPPPPPPAPMGVRLKTVTTQGAQVSENVTYIQGPRQRVEFPGVVSIDQCDTKQVVMLNTTAKRYKTQAYPEAAVQTTTAAPPAPAAPAAAPAMPTQMAGMDPAMQMQMQMAQMQMAQMQAMQAQGGGRGMGGGMGMGMPQPKGGVVTITTTITDTLERQKMFGLDARHVKTMVVKQFSQTACDKAPYKLEMDAWYVDLPDRKGCPKAPAEPPAPPASTDPNACTDRIEARTVGDAKLGFPLKLTTTTTTGEGEAIDIVTTQQEVTELETGSKLEKEMFETPSDFAEATSSAEIVPAIATGGSLADALFGSTVTGTSTPAPKKPGVIRIGVLEPINKTARNLVPDAHRQELVRKFSKPPYEALPVRGNSIAAIEGEAARLGVDYLLLTEVVDVKTSKPGKLGGMVSKATKEESKEKHEVKIDYKLYAANSTKAPVFAGNAKGSNGGFTMTSALKLAMFAGQIYMGMGGMFMTGGMGGPMGALGMMNPMMAMSGSSTSLGLIGGLYDPRAAAMRSLAMSLMGNGMGPGGLPNMASMLGGGDPSEAEMLDTVSEALGNEAKAAIEQLSKKK